MLSVRQACVAALLKNRKRNPKSENRSPLVDFYFSVAGFRPPFFDFRFSLFVISSALPIPARTFSRFRTLRRYSKTAAGRRPLPTAARKCPARRRSQNLRPRRARCPAPPSAQRKNPSRKGRATPVRFSIATDRSCVFVGQSRAVENPYFLWSFFPLALADRVLNLRVLILIVIFVHFGPILTFSIFPPVTFGCILFAFAISRLHLFRSF